MFGVANTGGSENSPVRTVVSPTFRLHCVPPPVGPLLPDLPSWFGEEDDNRASIRPESCLSRQWARATARWTRAAVRLNRCCLPIASLSRRSEDVKTASFIQSPKKWESQIVLARNPSAKGPSEWFHGTVRIGFAFFRPPDPPFFKGLSVYFSKPPGREMHGTRIPLGNSDLHGGLRCSSRRWDRIEDQTGDVGVVLARRNHCMAPLDYWP